MICEVLCILISLEPPPKIFCFFSKKVNFSLKKQGDSDTCYRVDES